MKRRHETPLRRVNPSGKIVWIARWTDRHGRRQSAGTFKKEGPCRSESETGDCCAQHAIDRAYERDLDTPRRADTVGAYAATWTGLHPRSERTNTTNRSRVGQVLDVVVEGRLLRDWTYADLRRRHVVELIRVLLVDQGRAAGGAQNVLRTLSAMTEDAITDEVADSNAFKGVKVRANDPRVQKGPRRIRVRSWQDMHRLCAAAALRRSEKGDATELDGWRAVYAEPMLRVLSDCGLRLGELMPLERGDYFTGACDDVECRDVGAHLHIRRTSHEGKVEDGTKTDHGEAAPGRVAPVPPGLEGLLAAMPKRIDTRLLFPTARGRLWRERNWYRDVWNPARERTVDATPHEFRHSWVSFMRAAAVDAADLAAAAGHTVETATKTYTHGLGRSFDVMRKAVGE